MKLKTNKINRKLMFKWLMFSLIIVSLFTGFLFTDLSNEKRIESSDDLYSASSDYDILEWIKYGNFSTNAENYWDNTSSGDISDVNASLANDYANYEILGNKSTYSIEALKTNKSNWGVMLNPDFPAYPRWGSDDQYAIDEEGFWTRHRWREDERQTPSVIWVQNVTMDVNMSDYIITSANISATFNASVHENVDANVTTYGDYISAYPDGNDGNNQGSVYDYVRFYVKIANPDWFTNPTENPPYTIAFNRTYDLGTNDTSIPKLILEYSESYMKTIQETDLIYYLTSVLSKDYKNFTIIVGFDIFCEDNCVSDRDYFNDLRIKGFNLTFAYEKKIDQLTSASWKQEEPDKIPDSNTWLVVHNATLNFKYKLGSGTWPTSSPNSELRIKINGNLLAETVNLKDMATTSFKEVKAGGIDVTSFVKLDKEVNVSIELYIGDEFTLDKKVEISIDNVSLIIEYELVPSDIDFQLWLDGQDKTTDKSTTVYWRDNVSIALEYKNKSSGNFIPSATVSINGSEISELLDEVPLQNYTIKINSTDLSFGNNYLTIEALKKDFSTLTIPIKIIVVDRVANISQIYMDNIDKTFTKTITKNSGELLPINITYTDVATTSPIPGATVKAFKGETELGTFDPWQDQYNYTLNTTNLELGVNFVSVKAEQVNFTTGSEILTIVVDATATNYTLHINETSYAPIDSKYYAVETNQYLNFSVEYNVSSGTFIPGAEVSINGSSVSEILIDNTYNNYTAIVETKDLNQGVNFLTIYAQASGYQPQSISVTVDIVQRQTNISLYSNNTIQYPEDVIIELDPLTIDEWVNLTVYYEDLNAIPANVSNANVTLTGAQISYEMIEIGYTGNYSLQLNASDSKLNWGINYLTITAQKSKFAPQTITLKVEIVVETTNYSIIVDKNDITPESEQTIEISRLWNDNINLTYIFRDEDLDFIPLANISIEGTSFSENFTKHSSLDQYYLNINTTDLGVGVIFLTLTAYKKNYEVQTLVFKVQVTIRDTTFKTYINGIDKTIEQSYKTSYSELITIKVVYNDTTLSEFIGDAIVSVNGTSISSLLSEQDTTYQITINSVTLGTGISFLTIDASKDNFESQSLVLTIDVIERITDFYLEINTINKTLDKSIEIPIRSVINITVSYTDQNTGNFISGATVSLIGENVSVTLTENATLNQYSVLVNSTDLDIGVRFLTVTAQKANYESYSARLRIQVNRIRTNITIESGNATINTLPGESVTISVSLHDLDYGGTIENATVTYSTDFGQGELLDPDGDGTFEAVLTNVPEGTYQITISVYADDDYDFERIRLTLNAIRPSENVLLFQVLTVVGIGAAIGVGGYLIAYQKVLKFPVPVRKIHKFKKSLKKKKSPSIELYSREEALMKQFRDELGKLGKIVEDKIKTKDKLKDIKLPEQRESPTADSSPLNDEDSTIRDI